MLATKLVPLPVPKKLPAFDVPVLEVIVLLPVNAVLNVADESVSKRTSSLPSVPKYRLPVEAMVELAKEGSVDLEKGELAKEASVDREKKHAKGKELKQELKQEIYFKISVNYK